jgi:hypothetical protein
VGKSLPLIHVKGLAIEDGRIASINYILYEMGVAVHLATGALSIAEACHLWRV